MFEFPYSFLHNGSELNDAQTTKKRVEKAIDLMPSYNHHWEGKSIGKDFLTACKYRYLIKYPTMFI
jgi:hypothetical protein